MAALLIGSLAASARAAFSPAVKLSASHIAGAKAAIDADGNVIAVWSHSDGTKWRVQERRISATGALSPVKTISAGAEKPLWPQIAGDPGGGAIVVWSRTNSENPHIEARAISAKGRLSAVKRISSARRPARGPRIASDAGGDAIAVWGQSRRRIWRIKARRISSTGTLGRVKTLSSARRKSEDPAVASDARGDAVATWSQPDGENWPSGPEGSRPKGGWVR